MKDNLECDAESRNALSGGETNSFSRAHSQFSGKAKMKM